jgi:hypothetical protein
MDTNKHESLAAAGLPRSFKTIDYCEKEQRMKTVYHLALTNHSKIASHD